VSGSIVWQVRAAQSTLPLVAALRAAVIGPSAKGTDARQMVSESRLIVAVHTLPLVSVGP
jgi:hypothetical protein